MFCLRVCLGTTCGPCTYRSQKVLWNWSYWCLWAAMWMLETEPFGRRRASALKHREISPSLRTNSYWFCFCVSVSRQHSNFNLNSFHEMQGWNIEVVRILNQILTALNSGTPLCDQSVCIHSHKAKKLQSAGVHLILTRCGLELHSVVPAVLFSLTASGSRIAALGPAATSVT